MYMYVQSPCETLSEIINQISVILLQILQKVKMLFIILIVKSKFQLDKANGA